MMGNDLFESYKSMVFVSSVEVKKVKGYFRRQKKVRSEGVCGPYRMSALARGEGRNFGEVKKPASRCEENEGIHV